MTHHVGILQLTQHLDDAVHGFKETLSTLLESVSYTYRNADGNPARLPQLARELAAAGVDLIFACSTPAAMAAKELPGSTPVVFTPVFDPVGSGLVANMEHPGGKATGMSGMVPAARKVAFLQQLLPQAKRVALVYHEGDANAILEAKLFAAAAEEHLIVLPVPLSTAEAISQLASLLPPEAEVVFLPIGRVVEENFASIVYYTDQLGLPIVASHGPNVSAGAIGALVSNHNRLGGDCARKAALILTGTPAGDIPVGVVEQPDILLNRFAAEQLAIPLPAQLIAVAAELYD